MRRSIQVITEELLVSMLLWLAFPPLVSAFTVVVTDGDTGEPIQGAQVEMIYRTPPDRWPEVSKMTDSYGKAYHDFMEGDWDQLHVRVRISPTPTGQGPNYYVYKEQYPETNLPPGKLVTLDAAPTYPGLYSRGVMRKGGYRNADVLHVFLYSIASRQYPHAALNDNNYDGDRRRTDRIDDDDDNDGIPDYADEDQLSGIEERQPAAYGYEVKTNALERTERAPAYCTKCGMKLPSDAKYCPNCGLLIGIPDGPKKATSRQCRQCSGSGKVEEWDYKATGRRSGASREVKQVVVGRYECPICDGTGIILANTVRQERKNCGPMVDAYEPSDDFENALDVSLGEVIRATINPAGDVDCYRFRCPKRTSVHVSIDAVASNLFPCIAIYTDDGQPVLRKWSVLQNAASCSLQMGEGAVVYVKFFSLKGPKQIWWKIGEYSVEEEVPDQECSKQPYIFTIEEG